MLKLTAQQLADGVPLPVAALLETHLLSRATHYRHLTSPLPADPDMAFV